MDSRTIDVVTGWETVAAPAGYEGLRQLADAEFSGAVSAGIAWAFLLNGQVVGVFEGDVRDFEDADLTAHRAPDPSLPLLFSMRERGGETRAKYYTNETPLSEVDRTLSDGGFTGYVELSENVLSGDYYVVYHGGKSMSAAFIGSAERLVTGDEAFETADDEVGIYEVVDVDIELVDVPEPTGGTGDEGGDDVGPSHDGASADVAAVGDAEAPDPDGPASDVDSNDPDGTDDRPAAGDRVPGGEDPTMDDPTVGAGADDPASPAAAEPDAGSETDEASEPGEGDAASDDSADPSATTDDRGDGVDGRSPGDGVAATTTADSDRDAGGSGPESASTGSPGGADDRTASGSGATSGEPDVTTAGEERWREARTIPSLDPEGSADGATTDGSVGSGRQTRTARRQRERQRSDREAGGEREATDADADADAGDGVERLRRRLSRARDRIEELEAERDDLRGERDRLESERAELTDRVEELEAERDRLGSEVERLESELDAVGGSSGSTSMSADRALSGTNLFVRYDSKERATLKHAHAGDAPREDVRENLQLEHHTTFETDDLTVDGRPYEEFLHDTTEYTFVRWVVSDLLYEIGGTGNRSELAGVFDAIPDVDRVELYGEAAVDTADGVEQRDFDVICRDRMGDPLFVADINPSRNATTEAMVGSLVENTGTVASEAESLAAGFYVTESFFEPAALETVSERTSGGLLSRSKKRSFVKLSRKRGYHLCLVEARDGEFHLNVPEL